MKRNKSMVILILLGSWFFLLLGKSNAADVYVDISAECPGDGSPLSPFCSLETAVATANDGDTIILRSGVYPGNLRIRKRLTIITVKPPSSVTLDVLQYNVQFLTPYLNSNCDPIASERPAVFGLAGGGDDHWPNTEERARAIGQALACFDIIGLSETINDGRRAAIIDELEKAATACGKPSHFPDGRFFNFVDGPDLPPGRELPSPFELFRLAQRLGAPVYDSDAYAAVPILDEEVMIISRLPIIATHAHIFTRASGEDALAAKGVLHARLRLGRDLPASESIDVFATHFQAGEKGPEIRPSQIEELVAFVRVHSSPSRPMLILGDLNIDGSIAKQADPNSEYNSLISGLSGLGVRDIGISLGGTNDTRNSRIDYIFTTMEPMGARVEDFPHTELCSHYLLADWYGCLIASRRRCFTTLSDHAGVSANFNVPIRADASLVRIGVP